MSFSYRGSIKVEQPFSLTETIESGQTFLWNKKDGEMFDDREDNVYYTTHDSNEGLAVVEVEQDDRDISYRSNSDHAERIIKSRLGLDHDLEDIEDYIIERDTEDGVMREAVNQHKGLRIVNEPLFPTLISFICSTQMRVERIHQMVNNMKQEFGKSVTLDDRRFYSFPTPRELSNATEEDLKNLKLGYRASYVVDTTEDYLHRDNFELPTEPYKARDVIKEFTGVGTKVADCVLLYGTGRMNVVPIDTWMDQAIQESYPDLYQDSNEDMARSFEEKFGRYSGYAQAYLFHHVRTKD